MNLKLLLLPIFFICFAGDAYGDGFPLLTRALITCMRSFEVLSGNKLSFFSSKTPEQIDQAAKKEWVLPDNVQTEFMSAMRPENGTLGERISKASEVFFKYQQQDMTNWRKKLVEKAGRPVGDWEVIQLHSYSPWHNRYGKYHSDSHPGTVVVNLHEGRHAIDRNKAYIRYKLEAFLVYQDSNLEKVQTYYVESMAIASEWEFMKLVPAEIRSEIISSLESKYPQLKNGDPMIDPTITYLSGQRGTEVQAYYMWKHSKLNKDEYIKTQQKIRKYTWADLYKSQP